MKAFFGVRFSPSYILVNHECPYKIGNILRLGKSFFIWVMRQWKCNKIFFPKSPVNDKTCNGKQDVISNYTKKVLKIQKLAPFLAFRKKKGINLCCDWCNRVLSLISFLNKCIPLFLRNVRGIKNKLREPKHTT